MNMYSKGFVVATISNGYHCVSDMDYRGIATKVTWPLDGAQDNESQALNNEAVKKWIGYDDIEMEIIPDLDYIERYKAQCRKLGYDVQTFYLELCSIVKHDIDVLIDLNQCIFLGYDLFSTIGLSYLCDDGDYFIVEMKESNIELNEYGLFRSELDASKYEEIRQKAILEAINIENTYYRGIAAVYLVK